MDPSKKQKIEEGTIPKEIATGEDDHEKLIYIKFKSPEGEDVGDILQIPLNTKARELEEHINTLLENEEHKLYTFFYET